MAVQSDERTVRQYEQASVRALNLLLILLAVDLLIYRGAVLRHPFSQDAELCWIVIGVVIYRNWCAGQLKIRPIEFLRFPLFLLGLAVVTVVAMLCAGLIFTFFLFDDLTLPVRIAIAVPFAAGGSWLVAYLLRIIGRLDTKITRTVKAEDQAEAIIYSDDIPASPPEPPHSC